MKRAVLLLLVLVTSYLAGCRPPEVDPFEAVREKIERLIAEGTDPSLAVAVARDGEIIWEEGFGLANREQNLPANEHTVYDLSSVSKPLTATGLMVLAERGLIDLDNPVSEVLSQSELHTCIGESEEPTVRELANHTSGLPSHYLFAYENQAYQPRPLETVMLRYGNLVSLPGERWRFSNLGYGVLGQVIADVSGKPFEEFMRDEVFLPLGMTHTSVGVDPNFADRQAVQYTPEFLKLPQRTYDMLGGLGIHSSAHDLIRFAMFQLQDDLADQTAILSEANIDEMQRATAAPYQGGYGVGWFVFEPEDGLRRVFHSGSTKGASANLVLVPEEDIAVVVLSSTSSGSHEELANDILAALLPDQFVAQDMFGSVEADEPLSLDPELIGLWQGLIFTYRGEIPLMLDIAEGGDPVVVKFDLEGPRAMLQEVSYGDDSLFFQSSGGGPFLRGCFAGNLGSEEMLWLEPAGLCLELKHRDGTLSGSILAFSGGDELGGYSLSYCVELWKD